MYNVLKTATYVTPKEYVQNAAQVLPYSQITNANNAPVIVSLAILWLSTNVTNNVNKDNSIAIRINANHVHQIVHHVFPQPYVTNVT